MVISQPAVVCLQVATHNTALRAADAGHRLRRIMPWGARRQPPRANPLGTPFAELSALTERTSLLTGSRPEAELTLQ